MAKHQSIPGYAEASRLVSCLPLIGLPPDPAGFVYNHDRAKADAEAVAARAGREVLRGNIRLARRSAALSAAMDDLMQTHARSRGCEHYYWCIPGCQCNSGW